MNKMEKPLNLHLVKRRLMPEKNWLSNFEPGTHLGQKEPKIRYRDFVNKELILFSMADLQRSVPSMVDGLKPGQRKILFCAFKRNLVKEAKVAQFSGYVSEHSAYHHCEQSFASTIISMAQDYVGSNNINLLVPKGQFGTRHSGGKDAASARYIFTRLSPITRVLFSKDDDCLLNYLNEDGQIIEPTWYMPIIPTVLVNGSEGIGTGWSTFIPNYNPRDIVANVRRLLNGESMVPMDPWYRGFKGRIEKTASKEGGCTYTVTGLYEEVDGTHIRITELPIRKWTDDYNNFVTSVPLLQDCRNHSDDTSVEFELTLSEENMTAARKEGFLKTFKLTTTISTVNMHLFDKKGVIKKYATPEQILEEFFVLRLEHYKLRKKIMLQNLELELLKLENKVRFILGVLSGKIIVINIKKDDLLQELRVKGFTPFPKKAKPVEDAVAGAINNAGCRRTAEAEEISMAPAPSSTAFIPGSEYDYLLAMSIATLTYEKSQELLAERDKMNDAVVNLKKFKPRSLWNRDLESLVKELDKLDLIAEEQRKENKEEQRKAAAGGTAKKAIEPESSNSAMNTDNIVAEVVKPKGRQPSKKKAPAAKKVEEEDDVLDLAERLAQYNFGSDSSKATEASKAIALYGDDDDDLVVEVAPTKGGTSKTATAAAAAPRKRGPAASKKQPEVVAIGVSPAKKVRKMISSPFNMKSGSMMGLGNWRSLRKMRLSPFNKKRGSMMGRLTTTNEEEESSVAGNSSLAENPTDLDGKKNDDSCSILPSLSL